MQRFIISPLFALSRFFINIYGIFLKFFLQLNGGYWSRIGLTENITKERIKKGLGLHMILKSGQIVDKCCLNSPNKLRRTKQKNSHSLKT